MGNWEKKSNGYKINYSGDRKDLSTYFKATGSVSKSVEDQFQNLFNKNYVYTINDYNREQKAARASKIKKRIIFVCVIVVLVMSWFIASINGLNKYGIGYDLNLSTFEVSIKKGALKSNPVDIEEIDIKEKFGPFKVVGINSDAFTKYENLTIVKIPSTITEIDYSIFRENHKLREIRVDENSEYFEDKEGVLYNKITKEIIWIPEQTSAINIYVSKDTTKVEKELFDHMHELMTIHYEGSIVEWSNVTNSLLAPCRIFCSDGATKVNNVIYKYNIQDDSLIYKETKFLSGVGASLPSIGEMQINNYVFYGWFINDQKTDIIDSNYTENVVVEGRYVKADYSFSVYENNIQTGSNKFDDNYIYGDMNIPTELTDLVNEGKITIKITGKVTLKIQTQGDATASGTAWVCIYPGVLSAGYMTSEKCSASAKGGGYNWYDFTHKNPKWGDYDTDNVSFTMEAQIKEYTQKIPVYVHSQFSSNKENTLVNANFNRYISSFTYTFVYNDVK